MTADDSNPSTRPSPAAVFRSMGVIPALAVTAGGLGFLRPASGTWGSLPPAVVAALLAVFGAPGWQIDLVLVLLLGIGVVACLRFGRSAEAIMGKKDPGQVVADEIAGQALTLLALPWAIADGWAGSPTLPVDITPMAFNIGLAVVGFLLFRIFDILKPPPANGLQRLGGGMGILVDDLIAGAMAAAVLQIGVRFIY